MNKHHVHDSLRSWRGSASRSAYCSRHA
uniref:Uncharacterized protein n=1 Tax=Arundo donax TaxID=35708 RepID=A0A0A8YXW7_ARUDO